jgi:hypothetical protein
MVAWVCVGLVCDNTYLVLNLIGLVLQEGAVDRATTSSASVGNSYLLPLSKTLRHCGSVRDMVFLHGYTEPVLLLLHEAQPTWPGHYRERKDSCCLSALSLNLRRKRHPVIWQALKLPGDCSRVMAVPQGGALVLSQNLLLYYTQVGFRDRWWWDGGCLKGYQ